MKIVCYGDSNTYGWDPRDFWGTPYDNPWPAVMGRLLAVRKGEIVDVLNWGEPGRCLPVSCATDNLLAMIKKEEPVNLVIVMLGSNDIINMMGAGIRRITERMESLIAVLKSLQEGQADMRILIAGVPYAKTGNPAVDEMVKPLNDSYQALAGQYGLEYIDVNEADLPLSFDGLHLTEESHSNLAQLLADYIAD